MAYPIGPVKGKLTSDGTLRGRLSGADTLSGGLSQTIISYSQDYNDLYNKPQINEVELIGNKTFDDLGMSAMSNLDIWEIIK